MTIPPTKLHLLLLLLTALPVFANETITVTVTGFGTTEEAAQKSAIQKAVRKAVGEMVDAETVAQNGELIKDKVLTYSDGFVKSSRVLSGPEKDEDLGLFSVTIEAKVLPRKVAQRLKEIDLAASAVAGEDIWAQSVSKISNALEGRKMLTKLLHEEILPSRLLHARIISEGSDGKPRYGDEATVKQKVNFKEETVDMTYMVEVRWDREAYLESVAPKLDLLLEKLAVAPPVEVSIPMKPLEDFDGNEILVYPSMKKCYDIGQGERSWRSIHQLSGKDNKKPGDAVFTFGSKYDKPGEGEETHLQFKAQWSEGSFLVTLDRSTVPERFDARIFTLDKETYLDVFEQSEYGTTDAWGGSKQLFPPRSTLMPFLIMELCDDAGEVVSSKLFHSHFRSYTEQRHFSLKSKAVKGGLLAAIEDIDKDEETELLLATPERESIGTARLRNNSLFTPLPENILYGRGKNLDFSDLVSLIRSDRWANKTISPNFTASGSNLALSSDISTFEATFSLPVESTKQVSRTRFRWMDDSWMSVNTGVFNRSNLDVSELLDKLGRPGLELGFEEGRCLVSKIHPGSPAAKAAAISPGDEIIGVSKPDVMMSFSMEDNSWDPFTKVDRASLLALVDKLAAHPQQRGEISQKLADGVKSGKIPLVSVVDFIMSGQTGTYLYLLVKPAREPTERLIVPVLLEHPSKFTQ